ncbi:transcriptional regulator [Candidatus Bathyarchaeota archaeon]|nr:transcriptional regulator [Candidatus Bathyarchaeota archaeon]
MANDRALGWIIFLGSLAGYVVYFWLLFMSQWKLLTLQVSNIIMVGMFHLILAWVGYTLATKPRARERLIKWLQNFSKF